MSNICKILKLFTKIGCAGERLYSINFRGDERKAKRGDVTVTTTKRSEGRAKT